MSFKHVKVFFSDLSWPFFMSFFTSNIQLWFICDVKRWDHDFIQKFKSTYQKKDCGDGKINLFIKKIYLKEIRKFDKMRIKSQNTEAKKTISVWWITDKMRVLSLHNLNSSNAPYTHKFIAYRDYFWKRWVCNVFTSCKTFQINCQRKIWKFHSGDRCCLRLQASKLPYYVYADRHRTWAQSSGFLCWFIEHEAMKKQMAEKGKRTIYVYNWFIDFSIVFFTNFVLRQIDWECDMLHTKRGNLRLLGLFLQFA